MREKRFSYWTWVSHLGVAGMYFLTLAYMIKYFDVQSFDIKVHNFLLEDYLAQGAFPVPPGYYALIYGVDMLLRYKYPFVLSALLVLTVFMWLKFRITYRWLDQKLGIGDRQVALLSVSMLFISPIIIPYIDGSYWYLGKFTPTIWHNSTLITVFPFCLLLFFQTQRWEVSGDWRAWWGMLLLGILIVLIKPSFLFCYIPALPLYALLQDKGLGPRFWSSLVLSLVFLAMLFLEKAWIYEMDPMIDLMYTPEERSAVVLNPLRVHLYFAKEPFFDLLCSFPSTLVFMAFWGREALRDRSFVFSSILLVFALMVYLLLAETGFRELHGNFYWQIPIAMYLHYLCMLVFYVRKLRSEKRPGWQFYLFAGVYLVQIGMGLAYWHRIFFGHALN